jgi:hypothetical protein
MPQNTKMNLIDIIVFLEIASMDLLEKFAGFLAILLGIDGFLAVES